MDIKLKASQMLLLKLSSACGDAQRDAVAEIRLFSKWDDANRACLAQAGAIALLVKILDDKKIDARVQENAMAALLNLSINAQVKKLVAHEPGGVDVVMRLAKDGGRSELKSSAAALLYSLLIDDGVREIVCSNEMLEETLVGLLKDGSSKCKAEALKALFVLAKGEQTREKLLQEKHGLVGLLVSLLTVGKVRLTEDCLALLTVLAGCATGAKAVTQASAVPILVYLVNSGSSRAQENATAVLLNVCRHDEAAKQAMPMQTLLPALNSLQIGESNRGKEKAEALSRVLGMDRFSSVAEDLNSYVMTGDLNSSLGLMSDGAGLGAMSCTVPFIPKQPAHINYSPPRHQQAGPLLCRETPSSSPAPSSASSASFSNASWPKPFKNKYISLAKNLFTTHKGRPKSHSSIN